MIQNKTNISTLVEWFFGTGTKASEEFNAKYTTNYSKINGMYQGLFSRNSDPDGASYWGGLIASNGQLSVLRSIRDSGEFTNVLAANGMNLSTEMSY